MPKISSVAAGVTMVALALAGCGSSSSSSSSGAAASAVSSSISSAASTVSSSISSAASSAAASGGVAPSGGVQTIAAQPNGTLAYTKKTLTAKAGTVKFAFTNHAPLSHNLTIQKGTSGAIVGATPIFQGGTKELSLTLAPGTYTFFCSVPGHRMAGMVGTLTVK